MTIVSLCAVGALGVRVVCGVRRVRRGGRGRGRCSGRGSGSGRGRGLGDAMCALRPRRAHSLRAPALVLRALHAPAQHQAVSHISSLLLLTY